MHAVGWVMCENEIVIRIDLTLSMFYDVFSPKVILFG